MSESKESLKDMFKNLLSLKGSTSSKSQPVTVTKESFVSEELWTGIKASTAIEIRVEKINELMGIVENELLDDVIIKKLWLETKDLLNATKNAESRAIELRFVRNIIKGQYRQLGIMRAVFFEALQNHLIEEDLHEVVKAFDTLTAGGKDVELFEQDLGPCLVYWLSRMKGNETLLSLLINIIKFNSSCLDQEVIIKILEFVCDICRFTTKDKEKELSLQVVDAVVCYSSLPYGSLNSVTITLCYTLNVKVFCRQSWTLMRKLLGTHLGHSCVSVMCSLLQNPKLIIDWPLLRSAVFFVGMALWGPVKVKSLKHSPQSVLPSFHKALFSKNLELAYEVTLTIQRLVRKYGHELQVCAWDHILSIVVSLLAIIEENSKVHATSSAFISVKSGVHEIMTFIEKLVESEVYDGPVDRLFEIIEQCAMDRPSESVFLLISHKLKAINPLKQNWIPDILLLIDTFFTKESRSEIQIKILEVLSTVIKESMELYEEELILEVLVFSFKNVANEKNITVKTRCLQLLFEACLIANNEILSLLHIIETVIKQDWTKRIYTSEGESEMFSDIEVIINGLHDVFVHKLCRFPGSNAVEAYRLLTFFLHCYYSNITVSSTMSHLLSESRKKVFTLLLSLRANDKRLLFIGSDEPESVSSFVCVKENNGADEQDEYGYLQFTDTLECLLSCLAKDSDWSVIERVLHGLNGLLQNKHILVGNHTQASDLHPCISYLDKMAPTLCTMFSNLEQGKRKVLNPPSTKNVTQAAVISVLSSMICYHKWLDMTRQRQILRCLESGFVSRCARQCVETMTLCIIEMPFDAVLRLLPSVLLRLTQMSSTVLLSTAVLGLLAMLAQMPELFSNFVEEQYKSIFAVALQYTNPSKFSRYVVSLAHFVIGTWFAKCRMSFRIGFVDFITRNLHAVSRSETPSNSNKSVEDVRKNLMESCIDMMAKYTFSDVGFMPQRSPLAKFIFRNGVTATWLVGNKLITITTSCVVKIPESSHSQSTMRRQEAPAKLTSPSSPTQLISSPRRRHKSGGAILKRLSGSHLQGSAINDLPAAEPAGQRKNPHGASDGEQSSQNLQNWLTSGWAEIYIRRPNGNSAWSMRIQNASDDTRNFAENAINMHNILNQLGLNTSKKDAGLEVAGDFSPSSGDTEPLLEIRKRSHSLPEEPGDSATGSDGIQAALLSQSDNIEPQIRTRSHTVSTSNNCNVETAAATAKLKAERRKFENMSKSELERSTSRSSSALGIVNPVGKVFESDLTKGRRSSMDTSYRQVEASSPSYVFLQLFQSAWQTKSIHRPILLPTTPAIERSIQVLDRIHPYDTWATGVIYVSPGDGGNGNAIVANEGGSLRYQNFLKGLGELVYLPECDPAGTFLGGLDTKGEDGDFTYVWREDVHQMVFHVTTLMPTRSDLALKKRHIGNDYVIIAYDDDNGRYVPGCVIQGQFRSAEVVIRPLVNKTALVRYVFHKEAVEKAIGSDVGPWLISDDHLPVFVRQLALQAGMAAYVCVGEGARSDEYSSKALARLKQIKRIRTRALQELDRDRSLTKNQEGKRSVNTRSEDVNELTEFSDYVR